ncbi:hypothetical protein [Tomitella fengzijianii]|uniref:hypothetical protein n=1 Tax=Tomitella fengzijianii TaxID=2597660 RepID=UPI0018EF25A4|nr:hypothetical protein [Tomitella fengzijianii]
MDPHTIDQNTQAAVAALDDDELVALVVAEVGTRTRFTPVRGGVEVLLTLAGGIGTQRDIALRRSTDPAVIVERVHTESAAEARVLEHPMLDSTGVADVLDRGGAGRSAAQRLRAGGSIVGVRVAGRYLHPAFQFDAARAEVRPHVARVNQLLDAAGDPWGAASWWLSPNGRLSGGVSPADLAASSDPESHGLVVAIAEALLDD